MYFQEGLLKLKHSRYKLDWLLSGGHGDLLVWVSGNQFCVYHNFKKIRDGISKGIKTGNMCQDFFFLNLRGKQ